MPEGDTLHGHAHRIQQALGGQTLLRAESNRVALSRFVGQQIGRAHV